MKLDQWERPDGDLGRYIAEESEKTLNSYREQEALVEEQARVEQDTAQGGYQHRQLFELIQNSADALFAPEGAEEAGGSDRAPFSGRIEVRLTEDCLYCANDGDPFDRGDVKALMFSHMSTKRGSNQIGTFGLGFKAVLGVCDSPEVYSQSGSFRFDRQRAHDRIKEAVPGASICPVMRLPEPVDPVQCSEQDDALRDLMAWATNIVRLPLKPGAHDELRQQMLDFPPEFILFVPHVSKLTINDVSGESNRALELEREGSDYLLTFGGEKTQWKLFQTRWKLTEDARNDRRPGDDRDEVPIWWAVPADRLARSQQAFWAYFPTSTSSLVPGILNAPWKTNEDRQNLLQGPYNDELITAAAEMIAEALPELATPDDPARHLDALPRRFELGDNDHADNLREQLFNILGDRKVIPGQDGNLQLAIELRYPPLALVEEMKESKPALDYWSLLPQRPLDWLHHSALSTNRLAKVNRVLPYKAPHASLAEWLEVLVDTDNKDVEASLVDASMAALRVLALIPENTRDGPVGRIVLTAAGDLRSPKSEVLFLPDNANAIKEGDLSIFVHPDLAKVPEILALLESLEVSERSPYDYFQYLVNQLPLDGDSISNEAQFLSVFWEASRDLKPSMAFEIIEQVDKWQYRIKVRTLSDDWKPLYSVLMPGEIVSNDGSRDQGATVDFRFHERDQELLSYLGIADSPNGNCNFVLDIRSLRPSLYFYRRSGASSRVLEKVFLRYQEEHEKEYRKRSDLRRKPRQGYVAMDDDQDIGKCVGPLDVLIDLSEEGRVCYTEALLEIDACFRPWKMGHQGTNWEQYPQVKCQPFPIYLLQQYGRVQTPDGIVPLADALEKPPNNPAALLALLRHPNADKIRAVFDLSDPAPEFFGEGEPVLLTDVWPGLGEYLSASQTDTLLVHCEQIRVAGCARECIFKAPNIYVAIDVYDEERRALKLVASALELVLSDSDIIAVLQRRTPAEVKAWRKEVRQFATDSERLLAAVGEDNLRSRLPRSLLAVLEDEQGPLTGLDIAEAAIATHHTDALRQFKEHLGHLDPPRQWAGGRAELEFVRSLGFSDEWAGEQRRRRPAFMEVEGPRSLKELHPYQKKVAANLREMLLLGQNEGAQRRGMISMPTGSGKTRVAVQAVVEAIRDDGFPSGVLWVADRDELCEQAVQAWEEVWRSEGIEAKQLRISRLWGVQPAPLPSSDLHVVVASVQTLHSRLSRRGKEYGFLRDFQLVVFDEAHRSISPTSTSVMREIGLTYRQEEEEPRLLGLTATPYRGHDEAETKWLARRYGENRLDRGAFRSDDPQEVIQELQHEGVLARANHELIEGGTFELSDSDWEEIRKFVPKPEQGVPRRGWLPPSVEDRIAANTERTRHIIEAYEKHIEPDWSTLIFATSVEHAQTLAALLNRSGITARPVSGTTEPATRRRVVEEFRSGEIQALVNYAVFREGFDAPKTRAIIVARPVYSPNLYFQMIGRGLRGPKNGGDDRCLILNVRDNIEGFGEALAFSDLDWLWDN